MKTIKVKYKIKKEIVLENLVNGPLCNLFIRFQDERKNILNQTTYLYTMRNYSGIAWSSRSIIPLSLVNNIIFIWLTLERSINENRINNTMYSRLIASYIKLE